MSGEKLINYTKEAFLNPINLGFLLIATLAAFIMPSTGPADFILTTAFGLELVYLGTVPRLPRFRRLIEYKKRQERSIDEDDRELFYNLSAEAQRKFISLKHLTGLVKKNFDKLPYSSQGLLENIRKKMDELLSNYLTLLDLHQRYQLYMNQSVEAGLRQEIIAQIEEIKATESSKLKNTKIRRVNILQKRLKKFEIAKEKYLVCETHLATVEDALRFIYEQSMTMSSPEEIGSQLDNLMNEVEETSLLIDELDHEILADDSFTAEVEINLDTILDEVQQGSLAQTQRKKQKE